MIENITWIMGIGILLFIVFKTFIKVETVPYDPETDELTQSVLKDEVLMKTMETLLKSNKELTEQIENLQKQMVVQRKLNDASSKIFTSLVLRMKELEEKNVN